MIEVECKECKGKGYNTYLFMGKPKDQPCEWCHGTGKVPKDLSDYIPFGSFIRGELSMQSQYGSRYLCGEFGYKDLGKDIRYLGGCGDYHSILIHKDDALIFKERMLKHRAEFDPE